MPKIVRFIFKICVILLLATLVTKPYNWFCSLSSKCQPFYISYYLPKSKGSLPIDVEFGATNFLEDVEFFPQESHIRTFAGERNKVTYHLTNHSDKLLKVMPKMRIDPQFAEQYLNKYECLCFKSYKLKPGESMDLNMTFDFDKKIENDRNLGKDTTIKILFKI